MSGKENKFTTCFKSVIKTLGNEIKQTVLTKSFGFWVGLAAWVLTIIQTIAYSAMPEDISSSTVISVAVVGIVLFAVLQLFRQTAPLASIALMICDFACIAGFASADGIIDYVTTKFFAGISMEAILSLPAAMITSIIFMLLSFITASVAIYMPQNKKIKHAENSDEAIQSENSTENNAVGGNI